MKKMIIIPIVAMLGLSVLTGCSSEPKESDPSIQAETESIEVESVVNLSEKQLEKILENNADVKSYFDTFLGKNYEDLSLKSIDGEEIKLESLVSGKNTILEFMGTWCPVCEDAAPHLDEFNKTNSIDVQALSIAINDTEETLKEFAEGKETKYYLPLSEDVMEKYNLQFVPIYFFIDESGTIQMILSGVLDVEQLTDMSKTAFNLK